MLFQICIIPKVLQVVPTWETHFVIVVQLVEMRVVNPLKKIFVVPAIMDGKYLLEGVGLPNGLFTLC